MFDRELKMRAWSDAEHALPIKEFYVRATNQEVVELLVANSADSLRLSLDFYLNPISENSHYKHAISQLSHSIEILFKARLARVDKKLILSDKKNRRFETIKVGECITRLENFGSPIQANHRHGVYSLFEARNNIAHFGFLGVQSYIERLLSFCYCIYWVFLIENMPEYGISKLLTSKQMTKMLEFDKVNLQAANAAAHVMLSFQEKLEPDQSQFDFQVCDLCLRNTVVIESLKLKGACRSCGKTFDMNCS